MAGSATSVEVRRLCPAKDLGQPNFDVAVMDHTPDYRYRIGSIDSFAGPFSLKLRSRVMVDLHLHLIDRFGSHVAEPMAAEIRLVESS